MTFADVKAQRSEEVMMDYHSKQRVICGFHFAAVKGVVVVARRIQEDSLMGRVDNERFVACPYNVFLRYGENKVRLDFSSDVTVDKIGSQNESGPIRVGFFQRSENGWEGTGDDVHTLRHEIAVREGEVSLMLSGIVKRQIQKSKRHDFCFRLSVIGKKKYLTGATCRQTKSELNNIDEIFRSKQVIFSKE